MINSTFGGFMTARLGMFASQHGLHITGQNLTNSATEGYTRQRIDQVSINYSGSYRYASKWNVNIGNGVLVTGTSQLRDPFLDLRYRNEMAHVGYEEVKTSVLNDLADILDEIKNSSDDAISGGGIFNQLGDILEKLHQLSNEVGNKEFDNMVKTSCQQLTTLLNSYSDRINEVENNLTYDLYEVDVPRVNEILQSISELNKTIKSSEIHGESALELKDQRNLLIDELSEYMKINVTYKPVQVSDSTVVDELYITMENSDPDKEDYMLVADEQYRQLKLTPADMQNVNLDTSINIQLSAMSPPDDVDTAEGVVAAQKAEEKAQEAVNNAASTYVAARDKLVEKINARDDAAKALAEAQAKQTEAFTAYTTAQNDLTAAEKALTDAKDALAAAPDDQKAALEAAVTEAQKAVDDALENVDTKNADYRSAVRATNDARTAAEKLPSMQIEVRAYNAAVENLAATPADTYTPAQFGTTYTLTINGKEETFASWADEINLVTGQPLVGGNAAANALAAAKAAKAAANTARTEAVNWSKAVDTPINNAFTDGKLRGTLEMLNEEGDYTNDDIRGIGYYRNMLDSFANTFADAMNAVNGVDAQGKPTKPLFVNEDTGTAADITAGNIRIAQDWMDNKYGVTATTSTDPLTGKPIEGANDNILRFISLFDRDLSYSTDLEDDPFSAPGGKEVFNGTFEEAFTNISIVLGLDIKASSENLYNYEQLSSSIGESREGVTGVSLDEEAMHIMQYQQSYNASARLMTALDEMLNTLITGTGLVGR